MESHRDMEYDPSGSHGWARLEVELALGISHLESGAHSATHTDADQTSCF